MVVGGLGQARAHAAGHQPRHPQDEGRLPAGGTPKSGHPSPGEAPPRAGHHQDLGGGGEPVQDTQRLRGPDLATDGQPCRTRYGPDRQHGEVADDDGDGGAGRRTGGDTNRTEELSDRRGGEEGADDR
jgi:hypothetical protein